MKRRARRSRPAPARLTRLAVVGALALTTLASAACHSTHEERCARCGMVIAPKSTWEADLVAQDGTTKRFDTPRCGLRALLESEHAGGHATLRVHEFYSGEVRDAKDVVFVVGSDVTGPMGKEIVPVDPSRAAKLSADHGGRQTVALAAVTDDVLRGDTP